MDGEAVIPVKKVKPPLWAVSACLIWCVAAVLFLFEPLLLGWPKSFSDVLVMGAVVSAVAAGVLRLVFLMERWTFWVAAILIGIWGLLEWSALMFGGLVVFGPLFDLLGFIGAIRCAFAQPTNEDPDVPLLKKIVLGAVGAAMLVAVSSFMSSFRCEVDPNLRVAKQRDLDGVWVGVWHGMLPKRLVFREGGPARLSVGSKMLTREGGQKVHLLRRGNCLHWGSMMTDYWAHGAACPQLSPDGQTLTFSGSDLFGVKVWHRRATETVPFEESQQLVDPEYRVPER